MNTNAEMEATKREVYIEQLSIAYAAAGRVLEPRMIIAIADSLVKAIQCRIDEIEPMFIACKNFSPIPTQMALQRALVQLREATPKSIAEALPKLSSRDMTLSEYEKAAGDYRLRDLGLGRLFN